MKLLRLHSAFGDVTEVYVQPSVIGYLSVGKKRTEDVAYTNLHHVNGDLMFGVTETPQQIFELIHVATGEAVEWHAAKPDADAVDTAIDEAYKRGKKDQREECEQHLGMLRDQEYGRGRKDAQDECDARCGLNAQQVHEQGVREGRQAAFKEMQAILGMKVVS